MREWTSAQKAAMSARGRTLLISAAAGSGKTSTLTERIIRRLTDPESPAELSRILIVTFTRAAAAELKERIASALSDAIAADPGNKHLQKQLLSMGSAHISTIDSFCREPVKTQFAVLGLPATTRIADDAELNPLKESVMGDIIDEFYIKYATSIGVGGGFSLLEDNPFADLCDGLTSSKNDEALIPTLLSLYDRLLCFPEELSRLKTEYEALENGATVDFFETPHGGIIRDWVLDFTDSAIRRLEDSLDIIATDPAAVTAYDGAIRSDLEFCRSLAEAHSYRKAFDLFSAYSNQRLGTYRGAPAHIVAAKDVRAEIVDDIKALRKTYFVDPPDAVSRQMSEMAVMCRLLFDLLTEYDRRIMEEKRSRGITDFTDNRRFLLKLLRDEQGEPSPFARSFAAQFDEVYIDEYQDVDEMQDEIFRIVGGDHRFMVGDIKQSIYGFRGADPSVFSRYRQNLTQMTESPNGEWVGTDPDGNSIFMSNNFRCDESIIRVTNRICGKMFRACPDSMGYQDADDLEFYKTPPYEGYASPKVEVSVLVPPPRGKSEGESGDADRNGDEALTGVDAEAVYVANQIAQLLRSGVTSAKGEPLRPGDIVILMRSLTAMPAYIKALTDLGIPTGSDELDAIDAGKDLLHGSDMTYLVNLLRVIDNPDNDIPLSEVLRAPFPGLDLEDILTLRNFADRSTLSASLYGNIERYVSDNDVDPTLRGKLEAFCDWIGEYRRMAASRTADGVLRLLKKDERCASRDTSAFLYLYDSARSCKASTFVSLYTFLRYFEKKIVNGVSLHAEADKDKSRVTIMTIHKSKGLEFPVCFLVRCGQYFSSRSQSKDLIFEKRGGAAMKLYRRRNPDGTSCHAKVDTTLRAAAGLSIKLTEREEEMRLLYVAMTRARERLYLVGTGSDKPTDYQVGDRFATLSCNCYLKWIRAGLADCDDSYPYARIQFVPADAVTPDEPVHFRSQAGAEAVDSVWASHYRKILESFSPPTEQEMALRRVPTKIAASKMRSKLLDECVIYRTDMPSQTDGKTADSGEASGDTPYYDALSKSSIRHSLGLMTSASRREFDLLLDVTRRPTAAEKGTATHLFLQYCDYDRVLENGLEEELALLTEKGFLDSRSSFIVDRAVLSAFFDSCFFKRIRGAVRIEREKRFGRFVPLSALTANPTLADALEDRKLFVQGSVDLIAFYEDGSMEICDYKTDHITSDERSDPSMLQARMQETHGEQLAQYVAAVKEMYGVRTMRVSVFSLPLGEALDMNI